MTQEKKQFTCKDCLHYVPCGGASWENAKDCDSFTPCDEWVHLPCKAGDTVFMPWEWHGASGIAQLRTLRVVLNERESFIDTNLKSDDYDYLTKYNYGRFRFDDFGRKVFRTEEEAEKALAERREK